MSIHELLSSKPLFYQRKKHFIPTPQARQEAKNFEVHELNDFSPKYVHIFVFSPLTNSFLLIFWGVCRRWSLPRSRPPLKRNRNSENINFPPRKWLSEVTGQHLMHLLILKASSSFNLLQRGQNMSRGNNDLWNFNFLFSTRNSQPILTPSSLWASQSWKRKQKKKKKKKSMNSRRNTLCLFLRSTMRVTQIFSL